MSASSKKKLRAERNAAKLTERQLAEQKEAKKVRLYTVAFTVVLVVLLVVAVVAGVNQQITSSGVRERKTTAVTFGSHAVSNAEMNYYFTDAVNRFYSQNGSYASMFGLDVTKPLDQQEMGTDTTWADYFLNSAKDTAKAVYAITDEARANGFTLTEEQEASIQSVKSTLDAYATAYGFSKGEDYLKALYGNGATMDTYLEYNRLTTLADAYQTSYLESLTYSDQQLREHEAGREEEYSSYSYNQYYLSCNNFLTGGTTDDEGNTTYSVEEKNAAAAEAEAAAKTLVSAEIASVEDLDAAIAALELTTGSPYSSDYSDTLYSSVDSNIVSWVSDSARTAGDKTYIPSTSTTTDEDGNEVSVVNGYYVVFFSGSSDNSFPLVNARHILVGFEGGTTDESGNTTYSDADKAAAKAKAEELLEQWKSGEATEDSFAALAAENTTDPGSKDNGGLYENITPGQMVKTFNDWCFDSARAVGDTGIVETEYGYHVMYFVGNAHMSYRDSMIRDELKEDDYSQWYTQLTDALAVTEGDTKYVRTDLVLNPNGN